MGSAYVTLSSNRNGPLSPGASWGVSEPERRPPWTRPLWAPAPAEEEVRRELHRLGLVDPSRKMTKRDGRVLIPVKGPPPLEGSRHGGRGAGGGGRRGGGRAPGARGGRARA